MFLHRFLSLHSLTYPALAGSVQHDGGMVLSNQLRHQNGRKPWGGNMYLQHPSTEWLYLQEVKSANHTNVNILGIAISKSALILKANVGKSCIKGQIEIHAASPSPVYHLACNNLPPTSTICLHIPLDINIMYISQL